MNDDGLSIESADRSLYLKGKTVDDINVISTLTQDAVIKLENISWLPSSFQFVLLLERFRWEQEENARKNGCELERVQALLTFDGVINIKSKGVNRGVEESFLWLLNISFVQNKDDQKKMIKICCAEDNLFLLEVEYLEITLKDVSKPYISTLLNAPNHGV